MTPEAWAAIGIIVSAVSAAISAIGVARINSTKTDVGVAKQQASEANTAAVEARELARPTGNGYAAETIGSLGRIEEQLGLLKSQIGQLTQRQVRTNSWLTKHLVDHAASDIRANGTTTDVDPGST